MPDTRNDKTSNEVRPVPVAPTGGSALRAPVGLQPSASYSFTMRIHARQSPGAFARVAAAVGETGAILGAIDLVRVEGATAVRDVTVACIDAEHAERVVGAVRALSDVTVDSVSDRTFLLHKGGKIEVRAKVPIATRDDLSMAYTPGVARVSRAIQDDPDKAWTLTIKGNAVAIISDGTAVLGLGHVGPAAAMPVMEGKALLFKEFGGVDAFPLCIEQDNTQARGGTRVTPGTSLNGHHLRMLDTPMPDPVVKLVDRREGSPRGAPRSALLAAIAFAHARYRRALRDAQRATETADRRAALAEARRIITGATRLQSRLGSREP